MRARAAPPLLIQLPPAPGFPPSYPTPAVFCLTCRAMAQTDELLRDAVALHQQGNLDAAASIYQQILERNPQNANALNLLGMVFHQRGENERAEDFIRKAIAIAPTVPGFHNNL